MSSTATIRAALLLMYPQFKQPVQSASADAKIDLFIEAAKLEIDATAWGTKYDRGVTLLACHLLEEAGAGEVNSGAIVREKDGEKETEYLRPTLKNFGTLSTTKYGRAYEALKESILPEDFAFYVI